MYALKKLSKYYRSNSLQNVRKRLVISFSAIAMVTTLVVFIAFSGRLYFQETFIISRHLMAFEPVAIKLYQVETQQSVRVNEHVTAYYSDKALPEYVRTNTEISFNEVTNLLDPHLNNPNEKWIYRSEFLDSGKVVPLYLILEAEESALLGDDSGDALIGVAIVLILFLIFVLHLSVKRVFVRLLTPIECLSKQLSESQQQIFNISDEAIDELKRLTSRLNSYALMKERVAKQELMFAKYASHELKTPISVILGAASLQEISDDQVMHIEQRERIKKVALEMKDTVELLLNIVKQENFKGGNNLYTVSKTDLNLTSLEKQLPSGVKLTADIVEECQINIPPVALSIIMKNLLDNSIRYTDSGFIHISINNKVITVSDSGKGLVDEQQSQHGIGLVIVERISGSYNWEFKLQEHPETSGCLAIMSKL
ncbi:sensor histidine kinase [Vibrio tasmaniensis]|uniref:sensor histidine kinase n=1 Tax=Vibrio tasmaniensis TaxID=212663 RepID=UPI00107FACF7|nr:HAMP domain-containing sensor histidine kinase [Vibrio tasmaniensis]